MEKAINVEAKVSLQPLSRIRKIDSRCPKDYRPIKKNKDKTNQENWNEDKIKPTHNLFSINISQSPT